MEAHPSEDNDKNSPSCRTKFFLIVIILLMTLSLLALLNTSTERVIFLQT